MKISKPTKKRALFQFNLVFLFVMFFGTICFSKPKSVFAVDCSTIPTSGNYTISSACAFPGTVNGVDAGSGSVNTAVLTLGTGSSLSILDGQTIAAGSIKLSGGSITIIDGGQIKVGTPLYLPDADGDGYPTSVTTTQYTSAATGRVRRSTTNTADCNDSLSGYNYTLASTYYPDGDLDSYTLGATSTGTAVCSSASTWNASTSNSVPGAGTVTNSFTAGTRKAAVNGADCNDGIASVWQNLTGYADADGDGYTVAGSSQICSGASLPSGYLASASSPTDANDAQACPSGANPAGACNKCVNGAIANQTSSEDVFSECTASLNACSGNTPIGPNGNCNGAGACSTTGNTGAACATHGICQTGGGCSGGSCVGVSNAGAGTDPYGDCTNPGAKLIVNSRPTSTCDTKCAAYNHQGDNCNGSGACQTAAYACVSAGSDAGGTDSKYWFWNETKETCGTALTAYCNIIGSVGQYPDQACGGYLTRWTRCRCQ